MKHVRAGLATGLLIALAAPVAHADVTVRAEGAGGTILPQTSVATNGPDVSKAGGTCPGNSAGGALDRAVDGNWTATNYSFGLSLDGIRGEEHVFGSGKYWGFDHNNVSSQTGLCGYTLNNGDEILFFAACDTDTTNCFTGTPLDVTAPTTATAGVPFTVTVRQFDDTKDPAVPSAAGGATVTGGAAPATTGADGKATVTVDTPGVVTLTATKGRQVRDEATVAVGAPGTTPPPLPPGTPPVTPEPTVTPDRKAPRSIVKGIRGGRVYRKRANAPRTLRAIVKDASGLRGVRIGLVRRHNRRCSAFSDRRGRFLRTKCGARPRFDVGAAKKVSFLLPERPKRGRYIFHVRAQDLAGNRERIAYGRNRVVFRVR